MAENAHLGAADEKALFRQDAYVGAITIEALRCLRDTNLAVPPGKGWTVILGENGTGKTTLLRAIADGQAYQWPAYDIWIVPFVAMEPLRLSIGRPFCYGYGAGRGSRTNASVSAKEIGPCATLLDESAELPDPQEWYLRTDYAAKSGNQPSAARLEAITLALCNRLIPGVHDLRPNVNPQQPYLEARTDDGWVPFKELAFGYRSAMAWILDFAARMFERYADCEDPLSEPAVVLVDEIDLHLHPRWQRSLIDALTLTFQQTQFIVTAHSPLIVQAAPNANLALLRREGDRVIIDNDVDFIRKWRVDQILASDLFGNQPVHAPEVEDLLERRRALIRKDSLTQEEESTLSMLNEQVEALPTAVLPEDQKLLDAIRKAASEMAITVAR